MQFKDEMKEGNIEFDGIKDPGMGKRATFVLTLTKPAKVKGFFERSNIYWDIKTKKAVGLRTYTKEIVEAFGGKYGHEICISVPREVIDFIIEKDEEAKEIVRQEKINQDFKFRLYGTSFGIYDGISEFDIQDLVSELKKKYDRFLYMFNDDIAWNLTKDPEIIKIAIDSYIPYMEQENWSEETKRIYRENVKIKRAAGYGIIPNAVIKEKISEMLEKEYNQEIEKENRYNKKIAELLEKAKETGEAQLISQIDVDCNDPKLECSTDIISYYAMPDGTTKETRIHTY